MRSTNTENHKQYNNFVQNWRETTTFSWSLALFVFIHLGNSVTSPAEMLVDSCFVYNRITKIVALLAAAASEERKATKNETVREFCVSRATLGH